MGARAPGCGEAVFADVLPVDHPNPVQVVVVAANVPLGNTATITLTPATGNATSVVTTSLE